MRRPSVLQKFRNLRADNIFSIGVFSANDHLPASGIKPETVTPRVGPCEGLCASPAGRVAFVHLPGTETRCWSLCVPLSGETILPLKCQEHRRRNRPGLPHRVSVNRGARAAQRADLKAKGKSGINFCHICPQCGQLLFGAEGSAG